MGFIKDYSQIVEPYLYLGGRYLNSNPYMVQALGFTHILNVASEIIPNQYVIFNLKKYRYIPADDSHHYNIRLVFEESFQMIDQAKKMNGKILVHCAMGISRSATIVIAYLMSRYRMSLAAAYGFVKLRRPEINPNWHFMNLLMEYEKELTGNYIRSQRMTVENLRPTVTYTQKRVQLPTASVWTNRMAVRKFNNPM